MCFDPFSNYFSTKPAVSQVHNIKGSVRFPWSPHAVTFTRASENDEKQSDQTFCGYKFETLPWTFLPESCQIEFHLHITLWFPQTTSFVFTVFTEWLPAAELTHWEFKWQCHKPKQSSLLQKTWLWNIVLVQRHWHNCFPQPHPQ